MADFSRRNVLAAGAAGGLATFAASADAAGTFGNPDVPPQGAIDTTNPQSLTDPGPQNPALANNLPSFLNPPATDASLQSVSRTVVGHAKSRSRILRSRRRFRASTCV